MSDKNKKKQSKTSSKTRYFHGDTAEEIAKSLSGNISEECFQKIIEVANAVERGEEIQGEYYIRPETEVHRTYENDVNQKQIIVIKTEDATHITPVLTHSKKKLELSLGISTQTNEETAFKFVSDINSVDGVTPLIIIPHKYDENDNEKSISDVLSFFLSSNPGNISIEEIECHGYNVSGKVITITQEK